jgi:Flp pilus assembly protein TadG
MGARRLNGPMRLSTSVRTRFRVESGAALVEFALVLPLLLTLLFGMIDFGRAFNYWIDQTHLASEGSRWAAVNKNPGGGTLQSYIQGQADSNELRNGGTWAVPDPMQVTICFPGSSNVGDAVEVRVTSDYHWLPFLGDRLGIGTTTLVASSRMRLEALPTNYTGGSCG